MLTICIGGNSPDFSHAPREKGNSRLILPKDYTIIDIETTGLDPAHDDVIEIACIKYRSNTEIDRFYSLIQPPQHCGIYVDDFITSLTGITNEMLSNAPRFDAISHELWDFLHCELLVGHNVNFDINFLYDIFQKENNLLLQNDYLDTMRLARRCLPKLKHHRLSDLAEHFCITGEHHRAVWDCLITNSILEQLAKIVSNDNIDLSTSSSKKSFDLRALQGDTTKLLPDHIFYDKYCVFTGKLERYPRKDAAQLITDIGAHCENSVTKRTNFLIIGNFDYSPSVKDGKSIKQRKAEQLILGGQDLQIISENTFYDLIADILAENNSE